MSQKYRVGFVGAAGLIGLVLGAARLYATGGAYASTEHGGNNVNGNAYTGVNRIATEPANACVQCHYKHASYNGASTGGPNNFTLFGTNNNALCYNSTCHGVANFHASAMNRFWPGQATFDLSGHGASTALYYYPITGGRQVKLCVQCHDPHGSSDATNGVYPRNTAYLEEKVCYSNNSTANAGCHGNNAGNRPTNAKDLYTHFAKAYKHPLALAAKIHSSTESQAVNSGAFKGANRHVECEDCHNPHYSKPGTHTAPTNLISNSLLGQWGVEPTYGAGAWTRPTSYAVQTFTDTVSFKEYQLCFKCHSSFAYDITPPAGYSDQSIDFNPNNKAAHPVRVGLTSQTGSVAPKALVAAQMSAPFATALGTQVMYCSDCHGQDATTDPQGPHGGSARYILNGPAYYWPKDAALALYTLGNNNATDAHLTGLFCRQCHPLRAAAANTWYNNVHQEHSGVQVGNVPCVACHVVPPHGSQRGRLIGYSSELAPYNNNGAGALDKLVLLGFKKAASRTGYIKDNCYSTVAACNAHTNTGGYDP